MLAGIKARCRRISSKLRGISTSAQRPASYPAQATTNSVQEQQHEALPHSCDIPQAVCSCNHCQLLKMDICYPSMDLAMGALPPTILPDYYFPPQQQQDAAVQDHIDLCMLSAAGATKGKDTAAAVPAAQVSAAHHTSMMYGSLKQELNYSECQIVDGSVSQSVLTAHSLAAASVVAAGAISKEQQQVALLHQLHMRHLQQQAAAQDAGVLVTAATVTAAVEVEQPQQQRSAVPNPVPAAATAGVAGYVSASNSQGQQLHCSSSSSKLTAAAASNRSNSSSDATATAGQMQCITASTAVSSDDVVVLCEESVSDYSSECSSPFSDSCCSHRSSMDMEMADDLDNRDQQQQQDYSIKGGASKAMGALQESALLTLLNKVASNRKGYAALHPARSSHCSSLAGPHTAAAAEAGSQSVRARLLITEVSVYCSDMEHRKCWANSPLALAQANQLMASMTLPESVTYMPITSDSWVFQAAVAYQFPSFVVCLGSSYMQRMMTTLPQLAEAAAAVPEFECYCGYLPAAAQPPKRCHPLTGHELAATKATLRSIQFTCLFLALKVADRVHALGLLRYILTKISHNQRLVSFDDAAIIESQCLDALRWRLGPWFGDAELSGNDEEMWAAAMGGMEYGTDMDCWE